MHDFNQKVAVITGAASGIGKALAEGCIKRNMKVVLVDINAQTLAQAEKEFKQLTNDVIAVVADVTRQEDMKLLVRQTLAAFNEVHLLFNNAGILGPVGAVWESDAADINHVLQCNVMGVVYGLKEFIPVMLQQNNDCYIVNTSSGAGLCTEACMSAYIASKHALVALSEVLYYDLKEINAKINVSVFCPGLVESHIGDKLLQQSADSMAVKKLIEFFKNSEKLPASVAAEAVFQAIETNQFYILTHNEDMPFIEKRMKNILAKQNPDYAF